MVEHVPDKNGVEGSIPSTRIMSLEVKENESLKNHSTFRIGGPARYFCVAKSKEEILEAINFAKEKSLPFFVFGGGSNILFRDEGFDGVAIKSQISNIKTQNLIITASSGTPFAQVIMKSIEAELTGLEWGIGIPGTIGGCVAGNCGAYGHDISELVKNVKTLDKEYPKDKCGFSYRESRFKSPKAPNTALGQGEIILEIELELKKGDKDKSKNEIKSIITNRKGKIPPYPSIGCIFKNPKPLTARSLIEQCGLKWMKIGDAQISDVHPNFIVNIGNASSGDVLALIDICKKEVKNKFNIDLQEEIVVI